MLSVKDIKRKLRASDETIQGALDSIDYDALYQEESAKVTAKILDPPVINGVNLLEHPNPTFKSMYTRYINSGGKICGIYIDGVLSEIAMHDGTPGENASAPEGFERHRNHIATKKAQNRQLQAIENHIGVTRKGGGNKRPNVLKPADFWAQFPIDKELAKIMDSTDVEVIAFVDLINSKNTVIINTGYVNQGLTLLVEKGLISQSSRNEIEA